jgi:hypothetical protein
MAKLSSLVVDLQVQSAQLKAGLDEANAKLDAFSKKVEKAAGVITAAFAFDILKDTVGRLAGFIHSGAEAADAMGKLAASVGVPMEEMSKLAYAAELSDVSMEQLGQALGKLSEKMAKAQSGSAEQAAVFSALGISVTDASGKLRSSDDVFRDIAQRFSEVEDGAAKTALAQQLFGESGVKLIPLLNEGASGLAALGDEAERYGQVVTQDGADASGQFNDALTKLSLAGQGLATKVAQDLAPSLAALAEELLSSKDGATAFDEVAKVLATTMRLLASGGVIVAALFEQVGKELAGYASALVDLVHGDTKAAKESLVAFGEEQAQLWSNARKRLSAIWEESGPGAAMAKDAEQAKPSADKYVAAINRIKEAEKEREEAAKRAAEARKKAEEAAKKAAEDAGKALEEYAKAQLALERQHQSIDSDVAQRRADAHAKARGESDPTRGFASFDAALETLVAALKAEASMREQAREMEKDGKLVEAHAAELAADAQKKLADSASRAADAFEELGQVEPPSLGKSVEGAAGGLWASAQGASPILGDVVSGASTGAAAGPVGAIVGGASALLAHSEGFQTAMDTVSGILQSAADSLGVLFDKLAPLLQVVGTLVDNVLGPLTPVFDALGEGLKVVALVVGGVVNAIALVWNGIVEAVAWVVEKFDGESAESLRKQKMKTVDMDSVLAPKTEKTADAVDKLGEAARDAASAVTNVPSWWKLEPARFHAAAAGPVPALAGAGNTTVITDNSNITIVVEDTGDPEETALEIRRQLIADRKRLTGSGYSDEP